MAVVDGLVKDVFQNPRNVGIVHRVLQVRPVAGELLADDDIARDGAFEVGPHERAMLFS